MRVCGLRLVTWPSCEDHCPVARLRVNQLSEALLYIYLSCDCQHFFPVEILIVVTMIISGQLTHLFEKGVPALIVLEVHDADNLPPRFCWVWRWEHSVELTPLTPENEDCSAPTVSGKKNTDTLWTTCSTLLHTALPQVWQLLLALKNALGNYLCLTKTSQVFKNNRAGASMA